MAPTSRTESLSGDQRRVVLALSVTMVGLLILSSSFNFVLPDMISDFGASNEQATAMRQVSSIGSLFVVFLAGVLGERLGERRVIAASALAFLLGAVLVLISPNIYVAGLGLLLASIGRAVILVVGIAYLSVVVASPEGRATAFSAISAVQPMVYLVVPVIAGLLLTVASWRTVALLWALGGVAAVVAARRLPSSGARASERSGEMVTPALAGVLLVAFVSVFGTLRRDGADLQFWLWIVIGTVSLAALIILYRRMERPTLSLAPLRHGGLVLMLVIVILMSFANLYYYSTILFEVVYEYSALGAAVLLIPAQACGLIGAVIFRKVLQRKGITFTGTVAIASLAVVLMASVALQPGWPVAVPVVIASLYALTSMGSYIVLTNAVMDLASPGDEGDTSAYRSAAGNVGLTIGVTLMTLVVTTVGTASMVTQVESSGMSAAQVSPAVWDLLYGSSPQDVSDQYGLPLDDVEEIGEMAQVAYVDAYRSHGFAGGVVTALAAALFFFISRRIKRASPAADA